MPAISMVKLFQVIYFEDSSITNYCIWHQSILVTIKFKVEWYWMHLCTVYQYISTVSAEFSVEKGCIYLPQNRRVKYAADLNDVLLHIQFCSYFISMIIQEIALLFVGKIFTCCHLVYDQSQNSCIKPQLMQSLPFCS